MNDPELEHLFQMIEDLIAKVRGTPWITEAEIERMEGIIAKYRVEEEATDVRMLTNMREDMYSLYEESCNRMKSMEKYTPAWENERRLRDMYFKFLNIPILFLIGIRDESFASGGGSAGEV